MLHFIAILLSALVVMLQTQLPTQLPPQTSYDLSPILPLLMATAQAIRSQDDSHKALSCIVISDRIIDKEVLPKIPSQMSSMAVFTLCEYHSLSAFREKGFQHRYDLAVMVLQPNDTLESVSDIVVTCRDLAARHVLAIIPTSQNLTAYGFAKVDFLDECGQMLKIDNMDYTAWQFNLFDYKQLPDWFNSRFWANPDNWNKFRW